MATENLDALDLRNAEEGGVVHEDVMDRIYEIDPEDRPVADSLQSDDADNISKEFVQEVLEPADGNNAYMDGMSLTGINDAAIGNRYSNYCQNAVKVVRVSMRGRQVNSIGTTDQMLWQIQRRQKALRRDEEAILSGQNGAQAGNSASTLTSEGPGVCAGLGGWIRTNASRGATGAGPVLSGGTQTGGYPLTNGGAGSPTTKAEWIAITPGNKRGLTETLVKDGMRGAFNEGGNPTLMISSPDVIEKFSDHLFTASARVATIQTNAPQGNRTDNSSGGGVSGSGVVAQGSVNLFVTNYGTLELAPNRFQPGYTAADTGTVYNVYLLDPEWFSKAYLEGYRTKDLARDGLADNSYVSVDLTLCAMAENGSAVIADIDPNIAVTA